MPGKGLGRGDTKKKGAKTSKVASPVPTVMKSSARMSGKHAEPPRVTKPVSRFDRSRGVTRAAIRRLARRGGCKRLSSDVYEPAKDLLSGFLDKILSSVQALQSIKGNKVRNTVRVRDVLYVLKKMGRRVYLEY